MRDPDLGWAGAGWDGRAMGDGVLSRRTLSKLLSLDDDDGFLGVFNRGSFVLPPPEKTVVAPGFAFFWEGERWSDPC